MVRCRNSVAGAVVAVDAGGEVVGVVFVDGGVVVLADEVAVVLPRDAEEVAPTVSGHDAGAADDTGVVCVEVMDASVVYVDTGATAEEAAVLDADPGWFA